MDEMEKDISEHGESSYNKGQYGSVVIVREGSEAQLPANDPEESYKDRGYAWVICLCKYMYIESNWNILNMLNLNVFFERNMKFNLFAP